LLHGTHDICNYDVAFFIDFPKLHSSATLTALTFWAVQKLAARCLPEALAVKTHIFGRTEVFKYLGVLVTTDNVVTK
jgi:hypothetical protein